MVAKGGSYYNQKDAKAIHSIRKLLEAVMKENGRVLLENIYILFR